jgi:hypothetical protein
MFQSKPKAGPLEVHDPEHVMAGLLGNGEHLVWSGRPRGGILFHRVDALLIPFSMLWAGFAISWEAAVISSHAPPFMVLLGLPFVAVGLYMLGGRFFADARRRSRTYYALTNKRVLIVTRAREAMTIKEYQLGSLTDLSIRAKPDGSGTLIFGAPHHHPIWMAGTAWPSAADLPAFVAVENVRDVHDRLRRAQVDLV